MEYKPVPIWDIPTRILHWVVAGSVLLNLFVLEAGEDPHKWTGYIAVGGVSLRLIWGMVGGLASRITSLPVHPKDVLHYLSTGFSEGEAYRFRHNPVASLAYLSIWALILALGVTGWMMGLDAFWGDEWLEELHSLLSKCIQILVFLHLLGIILDSIRYKRHTWLAMIVGRRK